MVSSVVFKMKPRVFLFSLQILLPFQTQGKDGRIGKIILGVHPADRESFSCTLPLGQERGFNSGEHVDLAHTCGHPGQGG